MYNKEQLEKALKLLGDRLEIEKSPPINLLVCGGSALIITGLVGRATTTDVDIVALGYPKADGGFDIKEAQPLPEILQKAAQQVARDLGMSENWLNPGPTDLVKFGLPDGFKNRFETRKYGKALTIHFLGRYDQIHLKLYAAVDQGPGKHIDDLMMLSPTSKEMESVARWSMTHDPSDGFKTILKDMLKTIGYESIAERI
jgi:hypothetical protein